MDRDGDSQLWAWGEQARGGLPLDLSLSPTGRRNLYVFGSNQQLGIGIKNVDGSNKIELVSGFSEESELLTAWSYDECYVSIFWQNRNTRQWRSNTLYVVDVETREIVYESQGVYQAVWSLFENKLAVRSAEWEKGWVWLAADDWNEHPVALDASEWAFSPDGTHVALVLEGGKNQSRIFMTDLFGQNLKEINVDGEYEFGVTVQGV